MLTKIPNVDGKKMPGLAQFVEQCMMRYEYRLDGSSLWEGRVLAPPHCHETIRQMQRISNGIASRLRWCERMLRYPPFRVPAGFEVIKMWSAAGIGYYRHDRCRAVLALQDIDVFLVHHADEAGYQWEVSRIEEVCREQTLARPRELFTGFGFTVAHRLRRIKEGDNWL